MSQVPVVELARSEDGTVPGAPLLSVVDLCVTFRSDDGPVQAVDKVSFDLAENETLGIVGESGSGKSVTSMAILGLLPKTATITGSVKFRGREMLGLANRDMRRMRGDRIAMVFQDALAALNPVMRVGAQIVESISVHHDQSKAEMRARAIDLLDLVGIPNPSQRVDQYPHEFSGGMRQRAMIAMSIANEPDVLIADEPTTALDVTIQAQVLEVMGRIQDRTRSSIILITHDLGVVAGTADRVQVMYAGRPVELGTVDEIFYTPRHPYTRGLLASLPRVDGARGARLHRIEGHPPSLIFLPSGCSFHPRCPYAELPDPCQTKRPEMSPMSPGHYSACHLAHDLPPLSTSDLGDKARLGADVGTAIPELAEPASVVDSEGDASAGDELEAAKEQTPAASSDADQRPAQ